MSGSEDAEPQEISPEIAELAKELGILLPGTGDWEMLTRDLGLSTNSRHVLQVNSLPGSSYSDVFDHFVVEVVQRIPAFQFVEYFLAGRFSALTTDGTVSIIESWTKRSRIFRLNRPATPERVAIMGPFINRSWTAIPFIEAVWEQGRMTAISMFGFASLPQEQRAEKARFLSEGMHLLRSDITKTELARVVTEKAEQLLRARGRRKGTGYFNSKDSFIKALGEVLKDKDRSLSVPQGLFHLSRNQFWQGKPLDLKDCQARRKTLRNWLTRCGLTWDEAKQEYCKPSKRG